MPQPLRLGVNIDHVATLRNARGGRHPDPVRAAHLAVASGADGITAHLREDRRHIRDEDIERLRTELTVPLNLEVAATDEMLAAALRYRPHAVCVVPERRQELTTEGGLDVAGNRGVLRHMVRQLRGAGVKVSLFIDPDPIQLDAAVAVEAPVVELHAGAYCDAETPDVRAAELERLVKAAARAASLGLECHAGHGLTCTNVGPVAAIPSLVELNIGHFLVGDAVFIGLDGAIRRMRQAMDVGRAGAAGAARD